MRELKKINNDLFLEALKYRNSIDPVIKLYKELGKEKEIFIEFQDGSSFRMDTSETKDRLAMLIAKHIVEKYKKYNFTFKPGSMFDYSHYFYYENSGFITTKHLAFIWKRDLNKIDVWNSTYIREANDLGMMTGDDVIIMKW